MPLETETADLDALAGVVPTQSNWADGVQAGERPAVSVILSTYNQPDWLERVLWAYAFQRHGGPFEVVIADDGSAQATRQRIAALRPQLPFPLIHHWQPDQGFRKCRALNAAIELARGDYLIFSDGDCLPRADFVATHLRLRRRGRFLSGGYIKLPMDTSQALTPAQILKGRHWDYDWLRANRMRANRQSARLRAPPLLARLLDLISPARASWNGHNASAWKADLIAVNGFDERMQYGGEDRELGERLVRSGVRGLRVRHRALVVHLNHPRGYVRPEMISANRAIRRAAAKAGARWTDFGLRPGPAATGNERDLVGDR